MTNERNEHRKPPTVVMSVKGDAAVSMTSQEALASDDAQRRYQIRRIRRLAGAVLVAIAAGWVLVPFWWWALYGMSDEVATACAVTCGVVATAALASFAP